MKTKANSHRASRRWQRMGLYGRLKILFAEFTSKKNTSKRKGRITDVWYDEMTEWNDEKFKKLKEHLNSRANPT